MTTTQITTAAVGQSIGQSTPATEASDLDDGRVEEFAGKVLQIIADASVALSLSIGHRTGLFDGLAVDLPGSC
ncbi:MAG TPA: hypothetical protein VIT65_00730 [Microlunatus sp.]